jgi:hypothetical protein
MPLAEKGVRGKGRQPLSPPQFEIDPERRFLALRLSASFSHGIAAHLNAVGVMDYTVEDSIGQGRICSV